MTAVGSPSLSRFSESFNRASYSDLSPCGRRIGGVTEDESQRRRETAAGALPQHRRVSGVACLSDTQHIVKSGGGG